MSWDLAVAGIVVRQKRGRYFEPVTMTDKNTEIRIAIVSIRTAVVPHCHLIPWPQALAALRFKPGRQSCIGKRSPWDLNLRDPSVCK